MSEKQKIHLDKIHKRMLGKHHSDKSKIEQSKKMKGRKRPPFSIEWKEHLGESRMGSKNWNWQGGKSFEPYSLDWTATLKRSIRERDHYTCQLCGALQGDISFDVHHMFYDKKDCNPEHLITLCKNCHNRTNFNRDYWKDYFNIKLIN